MRIIHSLEGKTWSGGQQQAFFLAREQKQQGHEVLLMCQKGSVLEQKAREASLEVWPVDYRCEIYLPAIFDLIKAYRSFKPDVVNVHRAWAHTQWLFVSLLYKFPGLIVTRRVLFRPDFNPASMVKYRSAALKGFIAVSHAVKNKLCEIGVKENKIQVVHSATDTNRFSPDLKHELVGNWPVPEGLPAALLVGNYHTNKGHELLINAFNQIAEQWPELNLVIAGKDTDSFKLRRLVNSTRQVSRIHLLGFRNDVPALMQRSEFTVNASYQEGFSGTIRESLALKTPVIASDIPANSELSSMVPLTLFESGNQNSLANAIINMKSNYPDENSRDRLRNLTVKHFSVEAMVKKTLQAYKKLV